MVSPEEFLEIIAADADSFVEFASSGANWEIAAQAKMWARCIAQSGVSAARELNYPGSQETVDIVLKKDTEIFIVEVKVETGTSHGYFGGVSFSAAFKGDSAKIARFDFDEFRGEGWTNCTKWVLFIAYSKLGKKRLNEEKAFVAKREVNGLLFGVASI